MTYVVAEPCIDCKYTYCVEVCPVECFHEGQNMVVIDPNECIECGSCEPECPSSAIFSELDLPEKWAEYVLLNERFAETWPVIAEHQDPLPDADAQRDVENKRDALIEGTDE